jgi:hypothetical protein
LQIREWDKAEKNDGRSGAGPGHFGAESRAKPGAAARLAARGTLAGRALFAGPTPRRMVGQNYRPGHPFQMDFFPQIGGYFQLLVLRAEFDKLIKASILQSSKIYLPIS